MRRARPWTLASRLSARAIPSPMKAQAVVTEGTPTADLHKPQLEQSSLAGNACGHGPVMGFATDTEEAAMRATRAVICCLRDDGRGVHDAKATLRVSSL